MLFLMLDALIFNRLLWVFAGVTLFAFTPKAILFALLADATVTFLVAIYASIKNRRLDVIYKFPMYFWLTGYLNPVLFLKTFVEIMMLDKEVLVWNKVQRY